VLEETNHDKNTFFIKKNVCFRSEYLKMKSDILTLPTFIQPFLRFEFSDLRLVLPWAITYVIARPSV